MTHSKGRKRSKSKTGDRTSDGKFRPGHSIKSPGNPRLKRLAKYQAAVRNAVTPESLEQVLAKVLELANEGDMLAAKVILDRTLGKVQRLPFTDSMGAVELPIVATAADAIQASNAIFVALNEGRISTDDASRLAQIVELARRTVETQDLANRIESLELERG